jgi:protocatechuate 3,4-dioxygenase beta subunit
MNLKLIKSVTVLGALAFLAGCGAGGGSTSTDDPTNASVATLSISSDRNSVLSDNSNTATITVTALDARNSVVPDATLDIQATGGQVISATPLVTGANGRATFTFSAGTVDLANRTEIITATVSGYAVTRSIPIQVTGSTLASATATPSPIAGVQTSLTATTTISNGAPAASQTLRFSIAPSSTGSGTLGATTATTDGSGNATVTFTGTAAGQVNVLIEWLNSLGNATGNTTQTFNVQAATSAFEVTTPSSSPWPVTLNTSQAVTVTTPATISGTAVAQIRYATTLGTWQSNGQKVLSVARSGISNSQTFLAGANAGNANIQIDALSAAGNVLATAKLVFALSASAATANSITLQSNVTALAPSSGGTESTATLTATVRDAANNAVGGASVLFELVNPTGSGEKIDPVIVSTNTSGQAQSTFTAGAVSTTQDSQIRASVVGNPGLSSTINITVGGPAASVAIGTSTTISSINNDTSYQLPVTVMVTDSNGNAVSGAQVSLSLWGYAYHKGNRIALEGPPDANCPAIITFSHFNEDINESLTLDFGEDVDGPGNMGGLGTPDGALWPSQPSVGSVPTTVTTGSDGTATFNWIYLKRYANWVTARMRASVLVQGSEATSTSYITLAPMKSDVQACLLPDSPFN